MNVKIVNKSNYGLPEYQTHLSAGMDLKANIKEKVVLRPGNRALIPTGLYVQIPEGHMAMVCSRSGLALKQGIQVLNAPGIIDADYTNEVGVILVNLSNMDFIVNPGDRIAQMVFAPFEHVEFTEVTELKPTERKGGFGHTGIN